MADKKITDLPEIPEVADDDYLEIVDTSANTSNKISRENLIAGHDHDSDYLGITAKAADSDKLDGNDSTYFMPQSYKDGWIPVSDTWTYKTATTITVPSGAASIYKVGMGIRLTQSSTVKYFYIVKVENTLLTITGGSDYTLADATISAVSYTNSPATAIGFPQWLNWTPTITWAGGTTDPTSFTVLSARYVTVGNLVFCTLRGSLTRGSGDRSYLSLTAPVTISNMASGSAHHNINGNGFVLAPLYSESGKVTIFTDTMTKDGYIWATWFYEKK